MSQFSDIQAYVSDDVYEVPSQPVSDTWKEERKEDSSKEEKMRPDTPLNTYRTKPCRFTTSLGDGGGFTRCKNIECKFAHSLAELRIPPCFFGDKCDRKERCRFLHPDETVIERYEKLKKPLPNLPQRILRRSIALINLM